MRKPILIIYILLSTIGGHAQTTVKVVHDTIHVSNNSKELELYKMLYQNAKDNSSANYTMLYTVVAIVVALLLFILGNQVFFNYRLKKSDLENLKSELELQLTTNLGKLKGQIQDLELQFTKDLEDKTKELKTIQDKQNAMVEYLEKRIEIMNSSVSELMTIKFKSSGSNEAALINIVNRCKSSLKAELDRTLALALADLSGHLTIMTSISDYSKDRIQALLKEIPVKYPSRFDNQLKEINDQLSKKQITKLEN